MNPVARTQRRHAECPGIVIRQQTYPPLHPAALHKWHRRNPPATQRCRGGSTRSNLWNIYPVRTTATPSPAPAALLRYTPSKARRDANLAGFLSQTRARDPAGARGLQELFAQGDVIARMTPLIGGYGLRIDNVADAYALWWISVWAAAHGRTDTFDKATYQAVRAQAAAALSATPEIKAADDAAKQQLAEALLIQSALLDGATEQAKGDPARLARVAKAAAQGGRGMGLDLMGMTLTPSGFVAAR
ncbi:DUF6683 family protein [Sphingomonas sp. CJ20]